LQPIGNKDALSESLSIRPPQTPLLVDQYFDDSTGPAIAENRTLAGHAMEAVFTGVRPHNSEKRRSWTRQTLASRLQLPSAIEDFAT